MSTWRAVVLAVVALAVGCGGATSSSSPPASNGPVALDETRSTVTLTGSDEVVADGIGTATLRVSLVDTANTPLAGVPLDLIVQGGGVILPSSGTTDATGVLNVQLHSHVAGTTTVGAIAHLASGLTPLSAQVSVHFIPGPASQLVFTSLPARASAGAILSPFVRVAVEDAWGNVVSNAAPQITVALAGDGGANLLLGTLSASAVQGVATFDDLSLTSVSTSARLTASAPDLPVATSGAFEILAGPPSHLASTHNVQGYYARANGQDAYQISVSLADGYGNPCAGARVSVSASGSANTFSPAAEGPTDGSGKFQTQLTSLRAEAKTLTVLVSGVSFATDQISFLPGPPVLSQSSLSVAPDPVVADGMTPLRFTAQLRDVNGNLLQNSNLPWVELIDPATGARVASQYFFEDSSGQMHGSFTSTVAGARTLSIQLSDGALQENVSFIPGPASKLTFRVQPTSGQAGETLPAVQVAVTDAHGNVIDTNTEAITLTLGTSPTGAVLGGSRTVIPTAGVASFDDLVVDRGATGLTLLASSASFQGTSQSFDMATWRAVGPTGGDVTAILATYNQLFVATREGGVFKSTDGGNSFVPARSGLEGISVVGLYTAAGNAPMFAFGPQGLFRSTDGASTWIDQGAALSSRDVRAVVWDSGVNSYFAATADGIYLSPDSGAHWYPESDGLGDLDVRALLDNGSSLIAGTGSGRIFRSVDAGIHWSEVSGPSSAPVTSLLTAPYSSGILLAGTAGVGILRSSDSGATWAPVTGSPATVNRLVSQSSQIYALTPDQGLFQSSNGGAGWSQVSGSAPANLQALVFYGYYNGPIFAGTPAGLVESTDLHTWSAPSPGLLASRVFDFALAPSDAQQVLLASSSGIFGSDDQGRTWTSRNGDLPRETFTSLAVDPRDSNTLYAASAVSGVYKSVDGGLHWSEASSGLPASAVVSLVVDPSTASRVFSATAAGQVFVSTDGAATWTSSDSGISSTAALALRADPTHPNTFYLATQDAGIFRTVDGGGAWTAVNAGLPSLGLSALSLGASGTVYVATGTQAFSSPDQGATWTALGSANAAIRALGELPGTPTTLYRLDGDGLFRSQDSGATWSAATTPTPDGQVLAFGPAGSNVLLLGSQASGAFTSTSLGL